MESFKSVDGCNNTGFVPAPGYTVSVNTDDRSAAVAPRMFDVPSWEWHPDNSVCGVMASRVYRIKRSRWYLLGGYTMPWVVGAACFLSVLHALSTVCTRGANSVLTNIWCYGRGGLSAPFHRPDTNLLRVWLSFLCLFSMVDGGGAVTCTTCFDQISGSGGSDCPLLKSIAANTAAIAATGAAVLTISQLLPFSYVRHLSSNVLRSLQAIARAPTGAAPVDLSTLDEQGLVDAYQQGSS